jgi:hypothetical protein
VHFKAVLPPGVRRLTTILAGALLVMWIPATSLCLAENAGLIASAGCCDDSRSTDSSPCCALASAAYKLDDKGQAVTPSPPLAYVSLVDFGDSDFTSLDDGRIRADVSPPELCPTWQFCLRAAAAPRAPSRAQEITPLAEDCWAASAYAAVCLFSQKRILGAI